MRTSESAMFHSVFLRAIGDAGQPTGPSVGGDVEPSAKIATDFIPDHVKQVASSVASAGGKALVVGGSVRDRFTGHTPKDFDVEVYGMHPDHLHSLLGQFGDVNAVGKSFGVLKLRIGGDDPGGLGAR